MTAKPLSRYRLEARAQGQVVLRNTLGMLRCHGQLPTRDRVYGYRVIAQTAFALYWRPAPSVIAIPGFLHPEDLAPFVHAWITATHQAELGRILAPAQAREDLLPCRLGWHLRADELNGVPEYDALAFAVVVPSRIHSEVVIEFRRSVSRSHSSIPIRAEDHSA